MMVDMNEVIEVVSEVGSRHYVSLVDADCPFGEHYWCGECQDDSVQPEHAIEKVIEALEERYAQELAG